MKKMIVAGVIALSAVGQAHAWGEREQGALAGLVVGAIALNAYQNHNQQYPNGQPPVYVGNGYPQVVQAPVITQQRYYCFSKPVMWNPYNGQPSHYAQECRYY
jgi:hypothetical protein